MNFFSVLRLLSAGLILFPLLGSSSFGFSSEGRANEARCSAIAPPGPNLCRGHGFKRTFNVAGEPDGSPVGVKRQAFEQRRNRLGVVATGIPWQPRSRQGEATVELHPASDAELVELYPYAMLYSIDARLSQASHRLVIDTGASNSVISQTLAESLELASTPLAYERVSSFVVGDRCAAFDFRLFSLPPLTASTTQVEGITALGLPFNTNPTNTVGVLGMDFLTQFDLLLSPRNRTLELRSPSPPDPDAIPLRGRLGLMVGDVTIDGSGPFPFMVDTGAALTVLSPQLAQQLGLDLEQAETVEVIGFCGTEAGHYLKLSRLALQNHQVQGLDVIILDNPVLGILGVDGILGQNFLNRYRQHWQFGNPDESGFPTSGSLKLMPE